MPRPYCPRRGDIVWLAFSPQAGHEQSGRPTPPKQPRLRRPGRPALALSPEAYNRKVGLAVFCPVTSRAKGYPFEVKIPEGLKASGVVLSDRVKSLDWRARKASYCCRLPDDALREVVAKLGTILSLRPGRAR